MILLNRDDIALNTKLFIYEKIWMNIQLYCRKVGKYCPYKELDKINLGRIHKYLEINEVLIIENIDNIIIIFKNKENKLIKTCDIKLFNEMDYHEKVVNQAKIELNML